ncbi:hypothetical protein [Mesorhizobium sp. M0715]|uniref:hypothetical protein n=1 Tax=Mesorhizobium sp. M0715 TaxID=2956990 RepID=UPI0033372F43
MPNASEKIADNVLLLAVARVSMALALPTIGLIVFFGSQWLDGRIDAVTKTADQANAVAVKANDVAAKVNDRLIAVETKQVQDMAANERFQSGTLTRLDRVQDSIVGLSNAVAALTATLQAVAEERNRSPPPR